MKSLKIGLFVLFAGLFASSMIILGLWISQRNELETIKYGYLNVTGTIFVETDDTQCVLYGQDNIVCCVDSSSYLLGVCPIIFDSNNYCVPQDASHSEGNMCLYTKFLSLDPKTGFYVKCEKKVCKQSAGLYSQCVVYNFEGNNFMHCSKEKVAYLQKPDDHNASFDISYKADYYNVIKFDNDAKFYDVSKLPIITETDLALNNVKVGRLKIAFIVLIVLSACMLLLGIGIAVFN